METSRPSPNWIIQPSLDPVAEPAGSGGYSPSTRIQAFPSRTDGAQLSAMVQAVLSNPHLMQQLGDRVYALLLEELRSSQERHTSHGGRF